MRRGEESREKPAGRERRRPGRNVIQSLGVFLLLSGVLLLIGSGRVRSEEEKSERVLPPAMAMPYGKIRFLWDDEFAKKVEIGADFNNWNPSATPLHQGPYNIWMTEVDLKPGKYSYKFVIDGQWESGDNRTLIVVRKKDGTIGIKETRPASNTPYNSRIWFEGRAWAQAVLRRVPDGEQVDTGRWRFAPFEYNLLPRMYFTAGDNFTGMVEMNMNQRRDRFTTFFNQGEVALEEDFGRFFLFRRRRAFTFDNPMRTLDRFRDTLDDEVYFTTEQRPKWHNFGRRFDFITRNQSDSDFTFTADGWQGFVSDVHPGKWSLLAFGADQMRKNEDLWGSRVKWEGKYFTVGGHYLMNNHQRGLIAAPAGGNSVRQNAAFTDTDGGVFFYPYINSATDDGRNYLNYDALVLFDPNAPNRDQWMGLDFKLGTEKHHLFGEWEFYRKDWSYVAFENGDGMLPNGAGFFNTSVHNIGEFLFGGQERKHTILFGGVWKPWEALGLELALKADDASALTLDQNRNLVRTDPSGVEFAFRGKYQAEKFRYGAEFIRRTVRDFPNNTFQANFDNFDFVGVDVLGANDLFQFKQLLVATPGRFTIHLGHRFRSYDLTAATLQTNELKLRLGYQFTKRLGLEAAGRYKSYDLPNDPSLTVQPGVRENFFAGGLRLIYRVSKYVTLNAGYGVNFENDEDVEWGQLFFMREALARAQRPQSPTTHALDQVLEAERALQRERRFEFNIDARF
ncbi:MAG: hypothetical protein D6679_04600 [Candidatus Hydrogenedentota bacterium]|nr:MAG: hypothetical protein D6679_04600 [Candidatus Hydrogenedentota bacterium]